jgi:hypothetical protein
LKHLCLAFSLLFLSFLPLAGAQSTHATFGTREPATCPDRKGPLDAQTAQKYVTCYLEGPYSDKMDLATNVVVQVSAPRTYIHGHDSALEGIDVRQRLYDIRGSYVQYSCLSFPNLAYGWTKDRNCFKNTVTSATGRCWKDTFGDWHCILAGEGTSEQHQAPPAGH